MLVSENKEAQGYRKTKRTQEPLLEYVLAGGDWLWRGSLLQSPRKADRAAARLQAAFAETYEYLSEVHPKDAERISRITMLSGDHLEIETGGDDFLLENKAGFKHVHVVGKYRPATVADFSRLARRGAKRGEASFRPIQDAGAWKDFVPAPQATFASRAREGLCRAARSALQKPQSEPLRRHLSTLLFEKDGPDLLLVATDGHRLTVHRLVKMAPYANLPKGGKALVPLPEIKELLKFAFFADARRKEVARDVFFDLRGQGPAGRYAWARTAESDEAWPGSLLVDGREYPLPLLDAGSFPNWRGVLPKGARQLAWRALLDAPEVAKALASLEGEWRHLQGSKSRKEKLKTILGALTATGLVLSMDLPGEKSRTVEAGATVSHTRGLGKPVRFYVNPAYLKDALAALPGRVLLAGYPVDTKGTGGETYVSRPLVFLDPAGPTETLLMPMWPPT